MGYTHNTERENLLKVRFSHFCAVLAQSWKSPKQLKIASWVKTNGFIESGVSESYRKMVPKLKTAKFNPQNDQHPISLPKQPRRALEGSAGPRRAP